MNITVYTTSNIIEHTDVDAVKRDGEFLCIFEGDTIYVYNLAYVTQYIQNPKNIEE